MYSVFVLSIVLHFISIHASKIENHSKHNNLNFLIIGDWGKGGLSGTYWNRKLSEDVDDSATPEMSESEITTNANAKANTKVYNQAAVAKSMAAYADNTHPSFVLALGDNFYTAGVMSSIDIGWSVLWENVYLTYDSLNIPWYAVLGNHDYGGSVRAQIDRYHENPNGLWIMPSTNYTRKFDIPGGGSVQVIFIDTTTLDPSQSKYTNLNGGISLEVQENRVNNQLEHIEHMLAETIDDTPTWLLVVGHYPIYSIGPHGDSSILKKQLVDLFRTYHVHVYLSGHDHISEHLHRDGVEYFVAGAGSMTDEKGSLDSSADVLWTGTGYSAFGAMKANTTHLSMSFIDTTGDIKYEHILSNPNELVVHDPLPPIQDDEIDDVDDDVDDDINDIGTITVSNTHSNDIHWLSAFSIKYAFIGWIFLSAIVFTLVAALWKKYKIDRGKIGKGYTLSSTTIPATNSPIDVESYHNTV